MAHASPNPTPDATRDARVRGGRTLLQGAISTILVAGAAVVVDQVTPGALVDWPTLGVAVATAVGTALAAWVQRKLEGDSSP